MAEVLADELGEDGAAGGVLIDGAENVFLRARLCVDAEELGEKIVRRAIVRDHAHEREVGHILHRRERRERLTGEQWERQRGHLSSSSSPGPGSPSSDCCLSTRARISVMSSTASNTPRAT